MDEVEAVSGADRGAARAARYWRVNLVILGGLMAVWFAVSLGAGVLFAESLNRFNLFGFPLGFWFAQQGSILVFVVLIGIYVAVMRRVDRHFAVDNVGTNETADPAS